MSAPVSIPRRRGGGAQAAHHHSPSSSSSSPSSATAVVGVVGGGEVAMLVDSAGTSTPASSYGHYSSSSTANTPAVPSPLRMASLASATDLPPSPGGSYRRRASLMSSALAASEHTVINVGAPDGPPRLGFDWNQEIFLPSHYDHLVTRDLERKRDPVHDIVLTDEEMHDIFPQ